MNYFFPRPFIACSCIILTHIFSNMLYSSHEEKDLELFTSYTKSHQGLCTIIDKSITQQGKKAFKALLQKPIVDQKELINRQNCIRYLQEHLQIYTALHQQLLAFNSNESTFIQLWNTKDHVAQKAIESFYYSYNPLKKYNMSSIMLNLGQIAHIINLSGPLLEHILIHFLLNKELKKTLKIKCCTHSHSSHFDENTHQQNNEQHRCKEADAPKKILYNIYNIAHLSIHFLGLKELIEHIKQKIDIIKQLHTELIAVSRSFKTILALNTLLSDHEQIYSGLLLCKSLQNLFNHTSPEVIQLIELLNSSAFNDDASFYINIGTILSTYMLLQKHKDVFIPLLEAIGQLDCYHAITQLVNSNEPDARYSFAHYLDQTQPSIIVKNFRNPFISSTLACHKTLELASNTIPAHLIITGPNGSGKSTYVTGIALGLWLGQTLTVIPAEYMSFTPFDHILTFMPRPDDRASGNSSFTSELLRAHHILESAQYKTFIAIDEPFRTTAFEKGQMAAYKFLQHIGLMRNCVSITATHFSALTRLAQEMPQTFKNYKSYLQVDNHKQKHYLLEEGISNPDTIFDALKETNIHSFLLDYHTQPTSSAVH